MKKELFYSKNDTFYLHKEYFSYLKENKIYIRKSNQGNFLLFRNTETYNKFIEDFSIPNSIICCVMKIAKNEYFAYFREIVDQDAFGIYTPKIKTNKKQSGEIICESMLFMGKGVYCIKEEDFQSQSSTVNEIKNILNSNKKLGDGTNLTTIIFKHNGPYFECVNGQNKLGIICIPQNFIDENNIFVAIDERIEISEKE